MRTAGALLVVYLLGLVAVLAYPYRLYDPLRCVTNTAHVVDYSGIVDIGRSGLIVTQGPIPRVAAIARTERFTIEVWAAAHTLIQGGPARIFTHSANPWARNFTLGQEDDALVIRLRTTATDRNGKPDFVVPAVFTNMSFQHLAVTFQSGVVTVYRNGDLLATTRAFFGSLSNWDPSFRLALGNEVTGNRAWNGEISYAALHAAVLSPDAIRQRAQAGPMTSPQREDGVVLASPGHSLHRIPTLRPRCLPLEAKPFLSFLDGMFVWLSTATDVVLNIILFVPFGLLVAFRLTRDGVASAGRIATVVLLGVVLSASFECLQFFLRGRDPR